MRGISSTPAAAERFCYVQCVEAEALLPFRELWNQKAVSTSGHHSAANQWRPGLLRPFVWREGLRGTSHMSQLQVKVKKMYMVHWVIPDYIVQAGIPSTSSVGVYCSSNHPSPVFQRTSPFLMLPLWRQKYVSISSCLGTSSRWEEHLILI